LRRRQAKLRKNAQKLGQRRTKLCKNGQKFGAATHTTKWTTGGDMGFFHVCPPPCQYRYLDSKEQITKNEIKKSS